MNFIDKLSLKQLVIICYFLIFIFGFISGMIVGEYREMKYITNAMNVSANTNHLIRDNQIYYTIQNFNRTLDITSINNTSIHKIKNQ